MELTPGREIISLILVVLGVQATFAQISDCDRYGKTVDVSESSKVTITSPNYPLDYGINLQCVWRVSGRGSTPSQAPVIKVTFNDFDLEHGESSSSQSRCPHDSLTFRDDRWGDGGDVLGTYCDTVHPEVVYSTKEDMYIKFVSDNGGTHKGFNITVTAVKPEESHGLCRPTGQPNLPSGSSGTLYTPEFPIPYPDDTTCIWTITAPTGKRVKLTFEQFELGTRPRDAVYGDYCKYDQSMGTDFVEIRDGPWSDSRSLGIYCGNNLKFNFYSTGRYMWVKFHSIIDGKKENRGFKARFEAVEPIISEEQCLPGNANNENLKLTGTDGTLQSPLQYYPPDLNCEWLITVPDGNTVKLSFDRFDLGYDGASAACKLDYVEVLDGEYLHSDSKGKFCGHTSPATIRSSGRYMRVVFNSDSEGPVYTGFKATFTAVEKSNKYVPLTIAVVVLSVIIFVVLACFLVYVLKRRRAPSNAAGGGVQMSTVTRSGSDTALAGVTEHSPLPTPRILAVPSENSHTPPSVGYAPVPTDPSLPPSAGPNSTELPPPYPTEEQPLQYPPSGESYPWQQSQASAVRESTF